MTQLSDSALLAQIATGIKTNGNREITPPIHKAIEDNIVDSKLSIVDGGNVVQQLTGYSTLLTPTDDKHFANKKYVDDSISVGTVPSTRDLTINGVERDLSANREWKTGLADTGVLSYTGASAASSTTIDVGAVVGIIVDNESDPITPVYADVNYAGATGVTVTTVGSGLASYLLIDSTGTLVFQNTVPTPAQRKTHIYLSKIGHPAGSITTVGNEPDFILSPLAQLRDLGGSIGFINNGVFPSANGANLNINISAGSAYRTNGNFVTDNTNPNNISVASQTAASFLYRTQTGVGGGFVTAIDPANYDVAGTITAIPGSSNQATNQYVYLVPGLGLIIQRGQVLYTTLTDAIAGVGRETFVVYPSLINNAILIGIISVTKGCTALNNTSTARFFLADKFGQTGGSTAGVTVATLQTAYNNSLIPQITTTTTLGAVTLRRGSGADTDNVLVIQNGAGTDTFAIKGNGQIPNDVTPYVNLTYKLGDSGNRWNFIYGANFNGTYLEINNTTGIPASFIGTTAEVYANVSSVATFATTNYAGFDLSVKNASGALAETARIRAGLLTPGTAGSENGEIQLLVEVSGTLTQKVLVNPTGLSVNGSVLLLDTTYKTGLDVSAANTLRIGNGFIQTIFPAGSSSVPSIIFSGSNATSGIFSSGSNNISFTTNGSNKLVIGSTTISISASTTALIFGDASNIQLGSTTGTKIGTATGQKIAFWNKTPIIQPTNAITAATFVANTSGIANDTATFGGYTIGQIAAALINTGILA